MQEVSPGHYGGSGPHDMTDDGNQCDTLALGLGLEVTPALTGFS